MSALNIEFTEEELAQIRQGAEARGTSMRRFVHDISLSAAKQDTLDERVNQAAARVMDLSRDLLKRLADR